MQRDGRFNANSIIPAGKGALDGCAIDRAANPAMIAKSGEYAGFQEALGYVFQSRELLKEALTHSSHPDAMKGRRCLSFLGSSVLTCAAALTLYHGFAELQEGGLDRYRSKLLSTEVLGDLARQIGLDKLIRLGKGVDLDSTRSILPKQLKSVVGAICMDSSRDHALSVARLLMERAAVDLQEIANHKNDLMRYCHHTGRARPKYEHSSEGPPHALLFSVQVIIGEERFPPCISHRLVDGEIAAAKNALNELLARDAADIRTVKFRSISNSRLVPEQ